MGMKSSGPSTPINMNDPCYQAIMRAYRGEMGNKAIIKPKDDTPLPKAFDLLRDICRGS